MSDKVYEELISDLTAVLATGSGRNLLWHILSTAGIYQNPAVKDDLLATGINIGKQELGKDILVWLEATDPTAYPKLLLEKQRQ